MVGMNFELVRLGWPNTVAVAALAVVPVVSLAAIPQRSAPLAYTAATATICPAPPHGSFELATLLPGTSLE